MPYLGQAGTSQQLKSLCGCVLEREEAIPDWDCPACLLGSLLNSRGSWQISDQRAMASSGRSCYKRAESTVACSGSYRRGPSTAALPASSCRGRNAGQEQTRGDCSSPPAAPHFARTLAVRGSSTILELRPRGNKRVLGQPVKPFGGELAVGSGGLRAFW